MMGGTWVSDGSNDFAFSMGAVWWILGLRLDLYGRFIFRLALVPQRQWMGPMNDPEVLIDRMVSEIAIQIWQLDDMRMHRFFNWLTAHRVEMKDLLGTIREVDMSTFRGCEGQTRFRVALKTWMQSLPVRGLLWEYRTLSAEIGWWRDLDPLRLKTIAGSKAEE